MVPAKKGDVGAGCCAFVLNGENGIETKGLGFSHHFEIHATVGTVIDIGPLGQGRARAETHGLDSKWINAQQHQRVQGAIGAFPA